ncbi:MAG TPA: hypothetical protein DHW71_03925 [Gammaproteobacteria bacterium]|nr:hypothetical protein [Gammaproteobacteria bacterium]HBF09264.1 hypothetical protein [Gammaproteobacteria bacterium]HCK92108.1 hypothetical protein [Gammaproteobacteria bacterium]
MMCSNLHDGKDGSCMSQILIVDDEPQNCQDIAAMLDDLDVSLSYCHRSENALAHIREIEPSLVLLDADMPGMNGYQVINQMWSDDDLRQIPVLLMTSHFADRKQLLHQPLLEVVDTLPKPLNPTMLVDRVKMALTLKAHQRSIVNILDDGGQAIRKRHEGVLAIDRQGKITFANATALALLRTNHQMIFGVYLESIFEEPNHQVNSAWTDHPLHKVCSQGNVLQVESCLLYCADGSTIQVKMAAIPMDKEGELSMVIAFRQIKKEEAETPPEDETPLNYLKEYDTLTGTYSRTAFEQVIDDRIKVNTNTEKKLAVLQVDLSHFNHVNETLGHDVGDRMLKDVVSRMRSSLRVTDAIGRIGGDVFAVLIDDVQNHANAAAIARKIVGALKESFLLEGFELYIACNVGIATFPECGKESASLLKNAAIAVDGAKLVGSNTYKFFTAQMNKEILERVQLEASLKHSLERGELDASLAQLKSSHLGGFPEGAHVFELRVQWKHPKFGVNNASELLDLFERYAAVHLYQELVLGVLSQVTQQTDANTYILIPFTISGLMASDFIELVHKHIPGIVPSQVGWMIQEDSLGRIPAKVEGKLQKMKAAGYRLGVHTTIGNALVRAFDVLDVDFVKFSEKELNERQQLLISMSQELVKQMAVAVFQENSA